MIVSGSGSPLRSRLGGGVASFIAAILPLIVLVLMATGCASFPVVVSDDPFKGVTEVSVDMWHSVLDSDFDNVRVLYYKRIADGRPGDTMAMFVFVATVDPYYSGYHGESLDRKAYILADTKRFTVDLVENQNESSKRSTMTYDFPIIGYHHFFYFYPGIVIRTATKQHILTATVRLTDEIQQALAGASLYRVRFYAGQKPVTIEATSRQMDALRKFMATGAPRGPVSEQGKQ